MEEELEENETDALAEDYPAKRDEGVLMQDESESGKGAGHAKEAGGKKNKYELDEPTVEELEVTEREEMSEDDPTVLNPPFPNESDDSSAHIIVKVQDCHGFLGAATQLPGELEEDRFAAIRPTDHIFGLHCCPH